MEKELPPRIGTFGQTGTLGILSFDLSPALLGLFQGLQRRIPGFGYFYVVLEVVHGHRGLYGLTRTRQRSRCLEVGNSFGRGLTALAVFSFAGKISCDRSRPPASKICSHVRALH